MSGGARLSLEGVIVTIILFALYASTLAPTILFGDSGELVAAAKTLGVAHPPGYALYSLAGNLALRLPVGELPAVRMNLLSAISAALACGVLAVLVRRVSGSLSSGMLAGLLLGVSPTFWSQALIAEVYATALLLLLLIPFAVRRESRGGLGARGLYLAAYIAGTGVAHHPIGLFYLPAILLLIPFGEKRSIDVESDVESVSTGWQKKALIAVAIFLLPMTVHCYLMIRANSDVALRWGDPATWSGLWEHVSRARYSDVLSGGGGVADLAWGEKLGLVATILKGEIGLPLLGLALIGFALSPARWPRAGRALFGAIALGILLLPALIDLRDNVQSFSSNRIFFLPVTVAVCTFAGLGAAVLGNLARLRWAPLVLLLIPVLGAARGWPTQNQRDNYAASDLGRLYLDPLPGRAELNVAEGQVLMPIIYLQQVEGVGGDVWIREPKGIYQMAGNEYGEGSRSRKFYSKEPNDLTRPPDPPIGAPHVYPYGIMHTVNPPLDSYVPIYDFDKYPLTIRARHEGRIDPAEREIVFAFYIRAALALIESGRQVDAESALTTAAPYAPNAKNGDALLAAARRELKKQNPR